MTKRTLVLRFIIGFLVSFTLVKAVVWTANVDSETGKPVKTFVVHVEYGANEDQIACPGTPGRVLLYSPRADGSADITCATPLHK